MKNRNETYFFGGAGNGKECFVEYGIISENYTGTIRIERNGEGIGNISLSELTDKLENLIRNVKIVNITKEKELTQ